MGQTVRPDLAKFAAELYEKYTELCNNFSGGDHFFDDFAPIGLELRTVDGLTARFYDEGIEFYPKEDEDGE